MYAKLTSATVLGIDGLMVEVEMDISNGLPVFDIVGLPDSAVKEAKERVRVAIKNSQAHFPLQRITVNLAPADVRKEGSYFDLAIALGLLVASDQLDAKPLEGVCVIGELSLDGTMRPLSGVLAMVMAAKQAGCRTVFLPADNAVEAQLVSGIRVFRSAICKKRFNMSRESGVLPHWWPPRKLQLRRRCLMKILPMCKDNFPSNAHSKWRQPAITMCYW